MLETTAEVHAAYETRRATQAKRDATRQRAFFARRARALHAMIHSRIAWWRTRVFGAHLSLRRERFGNGLSGI